MAAFCCATAMEQRCHLAVAMRAYAVRTMFAGFRTALLGWVKNPSRNFFEAHSRNGTAERERKKTRKTEDILQFALTQQKHAYSSRGTASVLKKIGVQRPSSAMFVESTGDHPSLSPSLRMRLR